MLHAVQASILTGQAFGPRLVVMSWQLERKLLTASGVLQAFHLQQLSRISRFQGMFLDEHLYLLLCFIVSYAFFQADSPTALLSRASATKPSTLTGWVGVENSNLRLQIWKISAKVWCMPCGTKAVDGWIHLLWGLWGRLVRSLSLLCSLAQLNDVAHCLSRFATEVQNRCQDSILLLFLRLLLCPSHPASHGRCSGIVFAVPLFCNGGLARGLPADSFQ